MADQLTGIETSLLARDLPQQPWHQVGVLVVDGLPDASSLARLVAQRIAYAPRFRQKLAGAPLPAWVDDPGFKVEGHVRTHRLAEGEGIESYLESALAAPLDRIHPLWDLTVLDGLGAGTSAVVVRVHPTLVDGNDNVHLLHELLDEQPAPIADEVPAWDPPREQPPRFGGLLRNLDDPLRTLGQAAAGIAGLAEGGVRQFTTEPKPRHVASVTVPLNEVKQAARRHATTVHDVLLALASAGIAAWLVDNGRPWQDPVALVPLTVVTEDVSAVGGEVIPQYVQLPVTQPRAAARLADLATLTQARIDSDRLVPARELTELAGFPPPSTHAVAAATVTSGRPHEVLIANVPGPSTPRWLGEQRVRALHAFASTVDDQVITVGVSSLAGRVSFAASAVVPLPRFARDVADELGVLRRAVH